MIASIMVARQASIGLTRRAFVAAAIVPALSPARAQEQMPRIVFAPALGVAQDFRVSHRLHDVPATPPAKVEDAVSITYRLSATALAREQDGYRLRLLVSEVERPGGGSPRGMDMVAAAALMLDGVPIEMLVDGRGFLKEVADWPKLQRVLDVRAESLPGDSAVRSIGHSVADRQQNAHQVAWHLAGAIEAMNFARSYFDVAKQTGASTISWNSSPIDVTVEPAGADGSVAMTWLSPSGAGARATSQGRAVLRPDGYAAPLTATSTRAGWRGSVQEITAIKAIPAR